MFIRRLDRTRLALISATSLTTPLVAFSQAQGEGFVVALPAMTEDAPLASTWYVNDEGRFVLLTEGQKQQVIELAQLQTANSHLQIDPSVASAVEIPESMMTQIIMYSAGVGGLAGGALVGGLMWASSDTSRPDPITVPATGSGSDQTPAEITVIDDAITRGEPSGDISYRLTDLNGIDESDLIASLEDAMAGASTIASIFPAGAEIDTQRTGVGLVQGTNDTYQEIDITLTGDVSAYLNIGTFAGPAVSFDDAAGNTETVNFQLTILEGTDDPGGGDPDGSLELDEADGSSHEIPQGGSKSFRATDPQGDTIIYQISNNPSGIGIDSNTGLVVVSGSLAAGTYAITITATSTNSDGTVEADTETYTIIVKQQGINETFGDYYSESDTNTINGTESLDTLTFGDYVASSNGNLTVNLFSGEDYVSFGRYAGLSNGTITINGTGVDRKDIYFSPATAKGGQLNINLDGGDDYIDFTVGGGNYDFDSGNLSINSGDGNDVLKFIDLGFDGSQIDIVLGDGDDELSTNSSNSSLVAYYNSNLNIDAGDGDDILRLVGKVANNNQSASSTITLNGGLGADVIEIGSGNENIQGSISVDLGNDSDVDKLIMGHYSTGIVLIKNYSVGFDDKLDLRDSASAWVGNDNGIDIVFLYPSDPTNYQNASITFEGLGGVGGSTDPLDYFM